MKPSATQNNTRFAPSPTGLFHMGHLLLCLVNREEADLRGGKFLVRMETRWAAEAKPFGTSLGVDEMANGILKDMAWCGVEPAYVSWQEETRWVEDIVLEKYKQLAIPEEILSGFWRGPGGRNDKNLLHHTPGKVVFDRFFGCTPIIRGEDLMVEHYWYVYLCNLFGFEPPELWYMPKLQLDGEVISKTGSAHLAIQSLRRDGWETDEVIETLRNAALVNPDGPFTFSNVKRVPLLTRESMARRKTDG